MRTRSTLILAVCGLALVPALLQAMPLGTEVTQQAAVGQASDRNAALEYWRLISTGSGHAEAIELAKEAVNLQMHPRPDAEFAPMDSPALLAAGADLTERLIALEGYLDDVERATRTPVCDFQLRYEDGYAVLMPHLGPMRSIAYLMVADARRLALSGDIDRAAERLSGAIRLARHVVGDRTLISSLVGVAIGHIAIEESRWLLGRTQDDAAVRQKLGSALIRFPLDDPYNAEAALRVERDMVELLARQFRGPRAGQEFMNALNTMSDDDTDPITIEVRSMNGATFKKESERAVDAFDLILEAWRADDPQESLRAIERACVEGDHGVVARLVVPALSNAQARDAEARAKLQALKDRVDGDG